MMGGSPNVNIFLNFAQINMGHGGVITIEDLGQLFECRSTGFNVEEVDEEKLDEDPDLAERQWEFHVD